MTHIIFLGLRYPTIKAKDPNSKNLKNMKKLMK